MSVLSTREVAKLTGFSMQKVQSLIRSGRIPAVNTSNGDLKPRWVVRLNDLEAFLTPSNIREAKEMASTRTPRKRIDAHVQNKVFG
jgi:excisionase family DNA binding protein